MTRLTPDGSEGRGVPLTYHLEVEVVEVVAEEEEVVAEEEAVTQENKTTEDPDQS